MRLKTLFFSLLLLLPFGLMMGQTPVLNLWGYQGQAPGLDSVALNSSGNTLTLVLEADGADFTGDVMLTYELDFDSSRVQIFDTLPGVSLNDGDTTTFVSTFTATNSVYNVGVNIMVVWPSAQNAITGDSMIDSIFVYDVQNSRFEAQEDPIFKLFPNPVREKLNLEIERGLGELERIEIVDLQGRALQQHQGSVTQLGVSGLPQGIYLIRMRFRDGSVSCQRFIKE